MRIENQEVIMSAEELNTILEFAVLNGCESCEFCPQCFFAADCITNDFKYYLEKESLINGTNNTNCDNVWEE